MEELVDRAITARYEKAVPMIQKILAQFAEEISSLGFSDDQAKIESAETAKFRLDRDPASGEYSLVGEWLNQYVLGLRR